ncbi:RusA family crossover junction endodeoxyribonuclease [Okeania sp.]|uniref:RusA family crossover junction endodeoxyribonuclease n=1 Tax=Okeania sp. TaxID=3100323 RepID=UPI002B4ADFFD|nr:RusA family crossover junction endodeoxyribonuclease [Okeania sp.]MEB3342676.1 RusA family crossover junction endodeoxyribonuclease [Okeania sp.]
MVLINWKNLINDINFKHQKCQNDPKNSMAYAYSLGQLLLEIKTLFSPTEWQTWFQKNCHFSTNCAETYLQIAKSWPSFRKQLDTYRKVDLSATEDKYQMQFATLEPKDNLPEKLETQINKNILSLDNSKNYTTSPLKSKESENSPTIHFYLPGKVVPKARPRVTANGTYLPPQYRAWRNQAEVEIYRQISELNLEINLPIKRAAIYISFCGKHRTNSDLDNLAGACLDALTLNGAGVLQDDRLSCIPKLTIEYIPNTKKTGVWIEIEILS